MVEFMTVAQMTPDPGCASGSTLPYSNEDMAENSLEDVLLLCTIIRNAAVYQERAFATAMLNLQTRIGCPYDANVQRMHCSSENA